VEIASPLGPVRVNRYLLKNKQEQALVLYWYQGRGRVEANEYLVKWDLLRDAALRRRTEEALVRVVVPLTSTEAHAYELASAIAARLLPAVQQALPT
jgi:EpsI family protein